MKDENNNRVSNNSFYVKALEFLKKSLIRPTIGTYVTIVAVLLNVMLAIVYEVTFTVPEWISYYSNLVTICVVLAIVFGSLLLCFKHTAKYAPTLILALDFVAFLIWVRYAYMYFSQIFYGGLSISLFFQMYVGYLWMIFLPITLFIILIVSCFLKQSKPQVIKEGEE